jgi:hypothetical protein
MVHTGDADGNRVASPAGEPTMDEVDTFFAEPTTAPSPNPPPIPNVTENNPGTAPQPTDTDLDASAASNPSTPGEKFRSTF